MSCTAGDVIRFNTTDTFVIYMYLVNAEKILTIPEWEQLSQTGQRKKHTHYPPAPSN